MFVNHPCVTQPSLITFVGYACVFGHLNIDKFNHIGEKRDQTDCLKARN